MRIVIALCAVTLGTASPVWAHVPAAGATLAPTAGWNWDAWVLLPLGLAGAFHLIGSRRLNARLGIGQPRHRRQMALFWSGWLVVAIALVSPIDTIGGQLFSMHMAQHELLMLIAAPLLVLSAPGGAFAWSLPATLRRPAGAAFRIPRIIWQSLTMPLTAWLVHAAVLWGWHLPVAFGAALRDDAVHILQHLSFILVAIIFWRSVLGGSGGYGPAILSIFTTAVHSSVLGALLTFSPTAWYEDYAGHTEIWGLTPLEDQQIGGLLMWVPGGAVYLLACLWLLARWLQQAARTSRRRAILRGPPIPKVRPDP